MRPLGRMEGKINLFGEFERKGYELLRASLREPFYEQSLLRQKAGGNLRRLPSFGLLAAKRQTRGSRFRDQSVLLVGDGALDVADRLAPPARPFLPLRVVPARPGE